MVKNILLVFLAVFAVALAGFKVVNYGKPELRTPGKVYPVVFDNNGFQPLTIEIKRGEAVEFKTSLDKIFWPASNLHPTHELYPEFDPKKPVNPTESWVFTFDKEGTWKYHDHLNPIFSGTIIVKP